MERYLYDANFRSVYLYIKVHKLTIYKPERQENTVDDAETE